MLSNKEIREIAKDVLMESIAVAYYKINDRDFSEEESEQITRYIDQYGKAMGNAIGERYYTM